jgi:hypothetical protein
MLVPVVCVLVTALHLGLEEGYQTYPLSGVGITARGVAEWDTPTP